MLPSSVQFTLSSFPVETQSEKDKNEKSELERWLKADLDIQFQWQILATDPISSLWNWLTCLISADREFSIKIRLLTKFEN